MYRRRLRKREIDFGFDSFLDLVANVIGVIIRFILVAWVGARSYTHLMTADLVQPPSPGELPPAICAADDPLSEQIAALRRELQQSKSDLLDHIDTLQQERTRTAATTTRFTTVALTKTKLAEEKTALQQAVQHQDIINEKQADTIDDLRKRSETLKRDIAVLGKKSTTKELRYRVPVSKAVVSEEVMLECQAQRINFIDLEAFIRLLRQNVEEKISIALRSNWQVVETTPPVGDYRMRYIIARRRGFLDMGAASPVEGSGFSYGLARWEIEPINPNRGETLEQALQPGSNFRRVVDGILPADTVVTIWVYPDSFELFRRIRDLLYQRGIEVAGRPLPFGMPIAASQEGTASRAQ